jgi:hypothetical protein
MLGSLIFALRRSVDRSFVVGLGAIDSKPVARFVEGTSFLVFASKCLDHSRLD